jgi:hypothetical protein
MYVALYQHMDLNGTYGLYNFTPERGGSRHLHVQGIWRNNPNFSNLNQQFLSKILYLHSSSHSVITPKSRILKLVIHQQMHSVGEWLTLDSRMHGTAKKIPELTLTNPYLPTQKDKTHSDTVM